MKPKNFFTEILSFFSCTFALREATPDELCSIRKVQNKDAALKLKIAACIFSFIQIFFIISDIITDFYSIEYSYLNLIAELLILFSSLAVIISLSFVKSYGGNTVRVIHFVYYLILETGIILYFASDLMRNLDSVYNAFFNMVILAIFVVYDLVSLLVLTGYISSAVLILVLTVPGALSWQKIQLLPLFLILFITCAAFFRSRNTERFISQIKLSALVRELGELSSRDFLTKLPNRMELNRYMKNELSYAIDCGKSIGILMIDIDDFKSYNDFHSHMEGDKCLHKIGATLNLLRNDRFNIFRYGGEEFLAIGEDVTEEELSLFAREIILKVRELKIPREDSHPLPYVTVSVGCTLEAPPEDVSFDDLFKIADDALYLAKAGGKNCYVYKNMKFTCKA